MDKEQKELFYTYPVSVLFDCGAERTYVFDELEQAENFFDKLVKYQLDDMGSFIYDNQNIVFFRKISSVSKEYDAPASDGMKPLGTLRMVVNNE